MSAFRKHCAKWKKADREAATVWFCLWDISEQANYRDRNQINGCQWQGLGKGMDYRGAFRKFRVYENILYLSHAGGYTTINIFQNTQNCTSIWKLYLEKKPTLKKKKTP